MKPKVNKDTCIGCGICPALCPEVFSMTDDGTKAEVKAEADYASNAKTINEAIASCPVNAISHEQE